MPQAPPFEAEPISISHAGYLQQTFGLASKRAWCYFTPFLCCFSLPPGREVFVKEVDGSVVLFLRRQNHKGTRIDLVVPPAPFSSELLTEMVEKIQSLNDCNSVRILWVDESDARSLTECGFQTKPKEEEYLYDPVKVVCLEGRGYRDLRKRLRRFKRDLSPEFRVMEPNDVPEGKALLRRWRAKQGRRHPFLLDWGYTRKALEDFYKWPERYLTSWCVKIDDRIAAFAMAGPIQKDVASFFVAKSDPDVKGLSEFLRYEVYQKLAEFAQVNDAGDLGLPGLRQFKMKFRPVSMQSVYKASIEE